MASRGLPASIGEVDLCTIAERGVAPSGRPYKKGKITKDVVTFYLHCRVFSVPFLKKLVKITGFKFHF